ncbi:MAG: anthranilate synthase component I, partial [Alphaproteobacteria bacterium]|nr:anthranilate synthase component I [Alphaproteobacteria bacterium]
MNVQPSAGAFASIYVENNPQVVWTTLVADLETPVSAMLKLADGRANAFLLESVEGGAVRGRFSIIGMRPDLIWRFKRKEAEINRQARIDLDAFEPCEQAPMDALRSLVEESRIDLPPELPPMASGLFGYMGYDSVRLSEDIPDENPDHLQVPDGLFLRPTLICIFDRLEDIVTIVTPVWPKTGMSADAAYVSAQTRLADAVTDFQRSLPYRRESIPPGETEATEPSSNTTREEFH